MKNDAKLFFRGLGLALAVVAYVAAVTILMNNAEAIFGTMQTYYGPIAFLLLFVLSAAIVGGLVLGQPILWYLEGKKKEAIQLFGFIVIWIFIFTVLILTLQYYLR